MSFFAICEMCFKRKFYINRRTIPFPGNKNLTATSKKKMCRTCLNKVNAALETNQQNHARR